MGCEPPNLNLRSSDADGIRASEFQHPVQGMNGDTDLGCSTLILARVQPVTMTCL
jgi:hypothetical protein